MQPIDPEKLLGKSQILNLEKSDIYYLNKSILEERGQYFRVKSLSRATGNNKRFYAYEVTLMDVPAIFNKSWIKKDEQVLFQK